MLSCWVGTGSGLGNCGSKRGEDGGSYSVVGQEMASLLDSLPWGRLLVMTMDLGPGVESRLRHLLAV